MESLIKETEEAYEAEQARRVRERVKLTKRKRFKLKPTEEDNEAHEAEQVEAHEGEQAEAQQRGRPSNHLKLSKEKRISPIKLNMRLIKLMKLNKSRRLRV